MEYGLIGEKLSHSFSKIIHNELADYEYELKEISREDLPRFMTEADFKAINVTIPYKQDVIPFLDVISDNAKTIGAVNTIVNKNGKLYGYNTDFLGLKALIEKNNISVENKKVLILGSGGTSKTAYAVADYLGASEIFVVSRKAGKSTITYEQAYTLQNDAQIIINTTPCGMYPNIGNSAIDIDNFPFLEAVLDAVYNPLSSALIVNAKKRGLKADGGLYMLVSQAAFAVEKFLDEKIPQSKTGEVYKKLLLDKRNLVFIGMPGCGKSTIGKETAKRLSKCFIDTDFEIAEETGKTIPQIFEDAGEAGFRKIETDIIKRISAKQSLVIATGGGAVLNPVNIDFLKENGIIVFIDRPIDSIVTTDDRPLSSNRELLEKRYSERYDIYKSAADVIIPAVENLETNIKKAVEVFFNENSCY